VRLYDEDSIHHFRGSYFMRRRPMALVTAAFLVLAGVATVWWVMRNGGKAQLPIAAPTPAPLPVAVVSPGSAEPADVLFVAFDSRTDMYVMDADGGGAARLPGPVGANAIPVWPPDGTPIEYGFGFTPWWPDGRFRLLPDHGYHDACLGGYPDMVHLEPADGGQRETLTLPPSRPCLGSVALSPDGTTAAVEMGNTTESDVYLVEVAGGRFGETRVLRPGGAGSLSWAPDGERLALAAQGREEVARVIILRVADGEERTIFEAQPGERLGSIAWAPVGDVIAAVVESTDGWRSDIWILDAAASGRRILADQLGLRDVPRWSPDGERLAVTLDVPDDAPQVHVISVRDGDLVRLTEGPGGNWDPVWSPDGRRIAFITDREARTGLYRVGPDGSGLARVGPLPRPYGRPILSLDGNRIAWASWERVAGGGGQSGLFVSHTDGSGRRLLLQVQDGALEPVAWSPDGRRLLFWTQEAAARQSGRRLEVVNADGSDRGTVLHDPDWSAGKETVRLVTWRGDAGGVIFVSRLRGSASTQQPEEEAIFGVAADGSEASYEVLRFGTGEHPVAWSPDGKHVAVLVGPPIIDGRQAAQRLEVRRLDGSEARTLATMVGIGWAAIPGSTGSTIAWSPDGSALAFIGGNPAAGLFVAQVDGSALHRLPAAPAQLADFVQDLRWSPDSTHVVGVTQRCPRGGCGSGFLFGVAVTGGDPMQLADMSAGAIVGWLRRN
jgi:Tol biopolymer transport system component